MSVTPYHWHQCPGYTVAMAPGKAHKPHEYACYNPECKDGSKRLCGLIVDAVNRISSRKKLC